MTYKQIIKKIVPLWLHDENKKQETKNKEIKTVTNLFHTLHLRKKQKNVFN